MHTRSKQSRALVVMIGAGLITVPILVPAVAQAAPEPSGLPAIVVNEVIQDNDAIADAIELLNIGDEPVDLSGWILADDKNEMLVDEGTIIAPGQYLAITVDDDARADKFGLGKADQANVKLPDGTLVDSYSWNGHVPTSYGRCVDGTGDFQITIEATPNAANACVARAAGNIVINEIESNDPDKGPDWVELFNTSAWAIDLGGVSFSDNNPGKNRYDIPAGTVIGSGETLVLTEEQFDFGLGGEDSATLSEGDAIIDTYSWTAHALHSYGRCPDGVGEFGQTTEATPGAANLCSAPEMPEIVVNEVETNDGEPGDWIELFNLTDAEVSLAGWVVRDNDDAHVSVLPADATIPARGFYVVEESQLGYGLGKEDAARLYLPGGHALVSEYSWTATADDQHAPTTFGRCPDGTGDWRITTASTKGAPNDCGLALRINEVETSDDWVEIVNVGFETADLSGMTLLDGGDKAPYVFANGTELAAGAYLRVDVASAFGLGGNDEITFADAGGSVIDFVAWTSHPAPTLGRCPDGTGEFGNTRLATPGAKNACAGELVTQAWPGADRMDPVDAPNTFGTDMSGVVYEADGTIWAVNNGNGTLHKLQLVNGALTEADGWTGGRTLRYGDGLGTVDAEGVAVIGGSSANGILVASERNTGTGDRGSRPSVLRYDISGTGELLATHEWNLSGFYPGIGANAGLEGVAWIPDAELVAAGLVDENTGRAYDPAEYAAHSGGVVFVGVEATNMVAGYVLGTGGEITRITEFETAFPGVMELEYDSATGLLWVLCDEVCEGRAQTFKVGADTDRAGEFAAVAAYERPAGTVNYANEGFAIAPISQCVDGLRDVLWANDDQSDGHAFRLGAINCTSDGSGDGDGDGDGNGDGGEDSGSGGTGTGTGSSSDSGSANGKTAALVTTGAPQEMYGALIAAAALLVALGGAAALVDRRRRA